MASATRANTLGASSAKKIKVRAALALVFLVWAYARIGEVRSTPPPPQFVVGTFAHAVPFVAAPRAEFGYVNARSGPGMEYPVQQQFDRGVPIRGIARRLDSNGAYWIELQDGAGFIKETVLVSADPARAM